MSSCAKKLLVCVKGKSCSRRDSVDIYRKLKRSIEKLDLTEFYEVKKSGCFGLCKFAPIIAVEPEGCTYGLLREKDVGKVVKRHVVKKKPSRKLVSLKRKK